MIWRIITILFFSWLGHSAPASTFSEHARAAGEKTTRVVSLVPNLTEIAFALGAGAQVAGVSDFCHYPPEARTRTRVGGLANPNLEAVVRLRPDVVFLYQSQAEFAVRLRSLGIHSDLFTVDTLPQLYDAIARVGTHTGQTTSAAAMVSQIQTGLAALQPNAAKAESVTTKPLTAVLIVSRDPAGLRNMYQATFLGDIFEMVGGKLALPGKPPVTVEAIIRANPDIIIDFSYAEESGGAISRNESGSGPEQHVGLWARLSTVSAVKSGRIYRWTNPRALLLGPHIVHTARQLKTLLED